MWGTVAGIAGKGAGFAGQGITRAVNAASYVGEVIAPTSPKVASDSDEEAEQDPSSAYQYPASSPGVERQQHELHQHRQFQQPFQQEKQPPEMGAAALAARGTPAVSQNSSAGSVISAAAYGGQSGDEEGESATVQAGSTRTYSAEEPLRSSPLRVTGGGGGSGSLMSPARLDSEEGGSESEASPTHPPSAPEIEPSEDEPPGGDATADATAAAAAAAAAALTRDDRVDGQLEQQQQQRDYEQQQKQQQQQQQASRQLVLLEREQQEVATLRRRLQARDSESAQARRQEEESRLALEREVETLRRRLDAREEENVQAHRRLALAEEESANRACALREDELEVESLRDQLQSLSGELQQSQCRESEQTHINSQLKQVIDQMRQVSRNFGEGAAGHARELEEAVAAKEEAEREVATLKEINSEIHAELEQALEETDQRSSSDREMATLSRQLKQAQARADEAEADKRRSEEAAAAKLASSQGLYQTALQREQQLGSQVKALTADLALSNQDKARHEEALGNLRGVLEEFHAERQTDVEVMDKRLKEELASQAASFEATKATLKSSYEAQLAEQSRRKQDERLKERRAEAVLEGENARIKEDLLKSRAALEEALSRLSGERDDMLDRQLVTNLIVRYITARHKRQVLELMARMFSFSEEEKEQVGLSNKGRSLPGLVTAMLAPAGQDDHKVSADPERVAGSSLSDLWMDFLITETEDGGGEPR